MPVGRGQGRQTAVFIDLAQSPGLLHPVGSGDVAVGDHVHPFRFQGPHGVLLHAGPAQDDPGPGIGQTGAKGESVDGRGYAKNGVGGHVADTPVPAHGSGDGPGDELALINAAVISPHTRIGHGSGAVENTHAGILRRRLPAGGNKGRRGGKDHLGPRGGSLLHDLCRLLAGADVVADLDGHLAAHDGLHIFAPQVVGPAPVAGLRTALVDKHHIQMIREHRVEQPAKDAAGSVGLLFLLLRLGGNGDGLRGGQQLHIRTHRRHRLGQLRGAEAPELLKLIHPQPHQQRVRRSDAQILHSLLAQGVPEVGEPGHKVLPLVLGPDVVRLEAQRRLELREPPRTAEIHPVQPRQLIGSHKIVVRLDGYVLRPVGNDPDHVGGNGGRPIAFQHTDPLVALLDVEPAQILIAADGVPDALVPQMGRAQVHPFCGKFRVRGQQRHESGRKGTAPSGSLGADDLLSGNLQNPHVRPSGHHVFVQNLVQHLGIGVVAPDDLLLIVLLAQF